MASKAPFEIWLKIAHYLPCTELQGLYTLNSALYNIAMDARYREVDLFENGLRMAKALWKFNHLSQPHIASRIRYITINLFASCQDFDPLDALLGENNRILHWNPLRKKKKLSVATRKFLASLSRITKCDLVLPNHSPPRPIIPSLWSAIGSHLQSLDLSSSLENIHSQLRSTSIHFPTLESLRITFYLDKEIFLTSIVHFLNRHSSLLRSLTFSTSHPSYRRQLVELSSLFNLLGYFPSLRHLGFYFGYRFDIRIQMSEPEIFAQFLGKHANQLRSFTINLVGLNNFVGNHGHFLEHGHVSRLLFNVPFPNMLKLDMSSVWMSSYSFRNVILKIIPWFSDTLTTLILTSIDRFTYEEVKSITLCFCQRPANTGLKSLSLGVQIISPDLIDLLASGFPGLAQLTLITGLIEPHRHTFDPPSGPLQDYLTVFRTEMEQRIYNTWALCRLDVLSYFSYSHFPEIGLIVEKRIPNIQRVREGRDWKLGINEGRSHFLAEMSETISSLLPGQLTWLRLWLPWREISVVHSNFTLLRLTIP